MSVLHLIPEFVFANTFHGSHKDVLYRTQWLEGRVNEYHQVRLQQDAAAELDAILSGFRPDQVLIEYTRFPKIVHAFRATLPDAWIGVRAHNIEPLQHLDNHGWVLKRGPLWMLYGVFRLLMSDIRVKRSANVILSINEWENRVYWDRMPGRAKVEWLPYISPGHLLPVKPWPFDKRKIIACLPTSQENRKSRDQVLRFQHLAREMKRQGCDFEFVVTGDLAGWNLPDCPEVVKAGFIDDLAEFMGRCRAVCMLSPLGYGFKTTIADALAAGAHIIAHPDLISRNPRHVQPFLIRADQKIDMLLTSLQAEPQAEPIRADSVQRTDEIMNWFLRGSS